MSDEPEIARPPRRRLHRVGIWSAATVVVLALLLGLAVLGLTGRTLVMPGFVTAQIEERLNRAVAPVRLSLGRAEMRVDRDGVPRVALKNVRVRDGRGAEVARLNELRAHLVGRRLISGQVAPTAFTLSGAQLTVRRSADGRIDLSFGGADGGLSGSVVEVLASLDRAVSRAPLSRIDRITAEDLTITLEDARTRRVWQATDGRLVLTQDARSLDIEVGFEVFNGTEDLALVELSFGSVKGTPETAVSVSFSNAAAADIAAQSPLLAFLAVLDAPISGALDVAFGEQQDGEPGLISFAGELDIGAGSLKPTEDVAPIEFAGARVALSYDPGEARFDLSEVGFDSDWVEIAASGTAWIGDFVGRWPRELVTQVAINALELHPGTLLDEPARFSGGAMDLKVRLDPFTATLGKLSLTREGTRIDLSGTAQAAPDGWRLAADLGLDRIMPERLLALWPEGLVPDTRRWVAGNVLAGQIERVGAALRISPDLEAPVSMLGFRFEDATVQALRSLPPIENGAGYLQVLDDRMVVRIEAGAIEAPAGGPVDISGSSFELDNLRLKPPNARLSLAATGSAEATLSLLDLPPVRLLRDGTIRADVAEGQVAGTAEITLPLRRRVVPDEVEWTVAGVITDVDTDRLVEGRRLQAERLAVQATRGVSVEIGGDAMLDGVPVAATWRKGLGPAERDESTVVGEVELSSRAVDTFGIGLPPGSVSGSGVGKLRIGLARGEAPSFELSSDLAGVGLSLPAVGWRKPEADEARLEVAGRLGPVPVVERLDLEAAGLTATGRIDLDVNRQLQTARFERVRLGGWLDASVTLLGRGAGAAPAVRVTGGSLDLRRMPPRGRASGASGPLEVSLDRVTVSQGIALTGFNGAFTTTGGFSGRFSGRVNGNTPVEGTLAPLASGTGVRVVASDAGAVARDIGLIRNASGGTLNLTLTPTGAPGTYDGRARIESTRLINAPAMAELLSAISVVGLLQQLGGEGIPFGTVDADFRLSPQSLRLIRSSAIGPSLGISLDGIYDVASKRVDLQGVVSPVYFLNGIGRILSPRDGEGLFGFNFRLTGPASEPQVEVNPLSILTPGVFREIFRSPPPREAPGQ